MNRGCWILGLVWGLLSPGHAMSWQDWWVSRDQQAQTLLRAGRFAQAAQTFQRADWRAMAAYRAGHYQQAAQNYLALQTVDGAYNAGNALAKSGQYQPAIAAYNQALAKNPTHQDALYNRALVQKLLDQQKQSQPSPQQQASDQKKSSSSKPDKSDANEKNQSQPSSSDSDQSPSQSKTSGQSSQPNNKQPTQPKGAPQSVPPKPAPPKETSKAAQQSKLSRVEREQQQAKEQWLRLIPDDPGGLLREKFLRDHLKRQNEWSS